ncbi:MAG: glycosyltransferase [bacterium]|nr:glycosyltransferase [bacterium]
MSDKNTLILLTHQFPFFNGEDFLNDELEVIAPFFDKVVIYPSRKNKGKIPTSNLPGNVEVLTLENYTFKGRTIRFGILIGQILKKEFIRSPSAKFFFSTLRFNLSLLKQCYLKALAIGNQLKSDEKSFIYSYWCDDLALIGSFLKLNNPSVVFISRAHGFDVFEEQSKYQHIFFRPFQLSMLDMLCAVSQAGSIHLKNMNPEFADKINFRYLGIKSNTVSFFEESEVVKLVSCSHVRSIKRLYLLIDVLKLVKGIKIEWHVIGDGSGLSELKQLSEKLPDNCEIIFYGHLSIDKIHALYESKHFDFLVSLSTSEGLPVSMMEAISHGIPIISTNVGGCVEIVNSTTGHLIPKDFSNELLASLILNCKSDKFNNKKARKAIVDFWKGNFFYKANYTIFAKDILALK